MPVTELWRRLIFWLKREETTRELEEEMRIHVEMRADSLRRAGNDGNATLDATAHQLSSTNDPAHAAARKRFGNTTTLQQRSRDMWGFGRLDDLSHDVRFAVRRLAQRPAFTAAVVGVMAIGIGATTAMFSAVDAALLRPLPFRNPDELVKVSVLSIPREANADDPIAGPHFFDFADARQARDIFAEVAAYASGGLNLADPQNPARLRAGVVTANFFTTLGVSAARGRFFVGSDGVPGGPNVVVISHGLWQRQYGGREITDLRMVLSTTSYEVVGVAPEGFSFPSESDVWIPMTIPTTAQTWVPFRNFLPSSIIARIAPTTTVAAASAQLFERLKQSRASMGAKHMNLDDRLAEVRVKGVVRPLHDELVGNRRTALFVLLGATGLLLLVGCVNVTNLLLSQATLRQRELAIRQSLGASRGRIIRQLLTESIVLAFSGASLGVLTAPFALGIMRALIPTSLSGVAPATIDWRVLGFATVLTLVSGIAFGLWPALGSAQHSDVNTIKSGGGHGATAGNTGRARRALVSVELALTVTLLIGAGLMLRSFNELMSRNMGMRPTNVGSLELAIPRDALGGRASVLHNIENILAQLNGTPGITAAGVINDLPLSGVGGIGLSIEADGVPKPRGDPDFARYLLASGGYFEAMGIPLLSGRVFTARDDSLAPKVAIIANKMAQKLFPNVAAVGRTFRLMGDSVPITVVGVVADVREGQLESDPGMQMYFPIYEQTPRTLAVVARSALDRAQLLTRMREAVRAVDRSQAIYNLRMMDDVVSASVAPRRTNTVLIAAFAGMALMLAAVGVFAAVSQSVSHRSRELGIRSALGATGADLIQLISSEMVRVVAIGIAAGLAVAWALARTLESLVYGVQVHDSTTFVVVPLAMLLPIVLATLIPAHRASRVNPSDVMRAD